MLACVYGNNGKLSLAHRSAPNPASDNVIIRVKACAVCGTDSRTYGHGSTKITPPRIIGHEVCGIITHIGDDISGFAPGERVAMAPAIGCGKCRYCRRGTTNMCDDLRTIGFQYDGGFAEYMAIPRLAFDMGNVYKVPEGVSDEEAAVAEPIACCVNAQQFLDIREGDFVAVFGAGFIGCLHAELTLLHGAARLIIIEMAKNRIATAHKMLADANVVNPASTDVVDEVTALTDGRGVDVVITACSSGKAQAQALQIAAKRARVSLFGGIPGDGTGFVDSNAIHYFDCVCQVVSCFFKGGKRLCFFQ